MIKTILTIALIASSIIVITLVLMQQDRDSGFAVQANPGTYWGKERKHSIEGRVELFTRIAVAVFLFLAFAINYVV